MFDILRAKANAIAPLGFEWATNIASADATDSISIDTREAFFKAVIEHPNNIKILNKAFNSHGLIIRGQAVYVRKGYFYKFDRSAGKVNIYAKASTTSITNIANNFKA